MNLTRTLPSLWTTLMLALSGAILPHPAFGQEGASAGTDGTAAVATPVEPLPMPRQLLPGQTLRNGDSVAVAVLGEPTVSGAFRIGEDGKINYPLLGKVPAANLTLDELSLEIKQRLEQDFIRKAEVSVTMTDRQQNSVFVYGAVHRQGPVNFDPGQGITLGRAVASVGGTSEMANLSRVTIQRSKGDSLDAINADLGRQQSLPLEDGDIIVVPIRPTETETAVSVLAQPAMGRVVVMGEVGRTGAVEVPLDGGSDILEVIALSGGFSRLARPSRVRVRRENPDGTAQTIMVDVDKMRKGDSSEGFRIFAGDTVFVPESVF